MYNTLILCQITITHLLVCNIHCMWTPPAYVIDTLSLGPRSPVLNKCDSKEVLATIDGFLHHCKEKCIVPDDVMTDINIKTINYIKKCDKLKPSRNIHVVLCQKCHTYIIHSCPSYDSVPSYCQLVKKPGQCCAEPVCEFRTLTGIFTGDGTLSGMGVGM